MTPTEQLLRDALERIKLKAVSLADAQVIALEALATSPSQAPEPAQQEAVPSDRKCAQDIEAEIELAKHRAAIASPVVSDSERLIKEE